MLKKPKPKRTVSDLVATFLTRRGWTTYYNSNYWVNPKLVSDGSVQDYTNYGMTLESAFIHEVENFEPFPSRGISTFSQASHVVKYKEIIEIYFGDEAFG